MMQNDESKILLNFTTFDLLLSIHSYRYEHMMLARVRWACYKKFTGVGCSCVCVLNNRAKLNMYIEIMRA